MKKMKFESVEIRDTYVEKLGGVLPEVVTEIRGKDGNIKKAVDVEKLKILLSKVDELAEPGDEKYEFTWVGKKDSIIEANKPIKKTLRPCIEESKNWDNTENLYIQGDNLEVLKLLQESYLNKIKMIYIDPPYNTGHDFLYNDSFEISNDEYLKDSGVIDDDGIYLTENKKSMGRFHSKWCGNIYSRLMLARNLLSDDGVIFISIDDHEQENLKKICDEIFGEQNYIGTLIWESTTQPINSGSAMFSLQSKTENIFAYAKSKETNFAFKLKECKSKLKYPHNGKLGKCRFEIIEKSDQGTYKRETMKFKILGQSPREGKRWQIGKETADELILKDRLEIVDGIVKKAIYPEDEIDKKKYKPFWSLLVSDMYGTAKTGKEELNSIMESKLGFDTVKPVELLKKIIFHSTNKDSIILDFFAGTSTTAHAVMDLNSEDGGDRKFIMVQWPEECSKKSDAYNEGYENICEIGKERIRRAGEKIKEENKDKEVIEDLDVGFRVLKVDDTNMKDVYYSPSEIKQMDLFDLTSNIKDDRTDLDLLFGCLIDWGVPLDKSYESVDMNGSTVHIYNEGDLVACFNEDISEETIKEIAKMKPIRVVFRDSSFKTSADKINVEEIFKLLSPNTRVRVL